MLERSPRPNPAEQSLPKGWSRACVAAEGKLACGGGSATRGEETGDPAKVSHPPGLRTFRRQKGEKPSRSMLPAARRRPVRGGEAGPRPTPIGSTPARSVCSR